MKSRIRRKIWSYVLALVMAAGAVPAGFGLRPAEAAIGLTLNMDESFRQYMDIGNGRTAPEMIYNTASPLSTALLWWDLDGLPSSMPFTGMYVLRYFKDDGKKVELTVRYYQGYYMVNYDVYDHDPNASQPYTNINSDTAKTYTANDLLYAVHAANSSLSYVPIANYFSPRNYNGGRDNAAENTILPKRVNNRDPLDVNYPNNRNDINSPSDQAEVNLTNTALLYRLAPSFNVENNDGYSFTYDGLTMHFYIDIQGRFYFSTNGLAQGRIYGFDLEYYVAGQVSNYDPTGVVTNNPLYTAVSRYVLTGIDTQDFVAIPVAENNRTNATPELMNEPDYVDATTPYNTSNLIIDKQTAGPYGEPAKDKNRMDIRFNLPLMYNITTGEFDETPKQKISATLSMNHDNSSNTLQIVIDDITNLPATSPGVLTNPAANGNVNGVTTHTGGNAKAVDVSLPEPTTAPNRMRILIDDMQPGVIFFSSNLQIDANWLVARDTDIDGGYRQLYTFMEYDIVSIGGKLYVAVTPYGVDGQYRLKSGVGLQPAIIQNSSGTKTILFPLTISSQNPSQMQYQVDFTRTNFDSKNIFSSQIVLYTPEKSLSGMGLPENFKVMKGVDPVDRDADGNPVDKSYQLYPLASAPDGTEGMLTFWTQWDLGNRIMVDELISGGSLTVEYEVYASLVPDDKDGTRFLFDTVTLDIVTSGADLYVTYKDNTNKIINTEPTLLKQRADFSTAPATYTYYADVGFTATAAKDDPYVLITSDFKYPNIYFLNVKPIQWTKGGTTQLMADFPASQYDYMTLSDLTSLIVPSPKDLVVEAVTVESGATADRPALEVSFDISGYALQTYINSRYPYSNNEVTVNLYIGQNETALTENFYGDADKLAASRAAAVVVPYEDSYGKDLYFSDTTVSGAVMQAMDITGSGDARDALRSGKTVWIQDITLTDAEAKMLLESHGTLHLAYMLEGLDKNQKYYVFADIVLTQWDSGLNADVPGGQNKPVIAGSILSEMDGATTAGDENIPDESERVPSSPDLKLDVDSVGLGQASLNWTKIYPQAPLDANNAAETIEYEIIRLKDKQMDATLQSKRADFATVYSGLPSVERAAWRTINGQLTLYNPNTGQFDSLSGTDRYAYDQSGDPIVFSDYSLTPNQLYFYYVRTVRVIPGTGQRVVSTWARVSVTTEPVQNPKNLRVENGLDNYDPETEIVVSFDAPVPDISKLGTDYILQYQIRQDNGSWSAPIDMELSQLQNPLNHSALGPDGYRHFFYKISDLETNMLYTVRVRMLDCQSGDGSLYTNSVQFKTDIDQQEYDDYLKYNDWMAYLAGELEKLLKDPYWLAADNDYAQTVVYRTEMIDALIAASTNGQMILYGGTANNVTYYIPISALVAVNQANKSLKIAFPDMDVILSAKAFNPDYNEAAAYMAKGIKNKDYSDYFVRVSLIRLPVAGTVEGQTPLTYQTRIAVETVGTVTSIYNIKTWDDDLFAQFAVLVDAKIEDVTLKDALMQQIADGAVSEELMQYVHDVVASMRDDLVKAVADQLTTNANKGILADSVTVNQLNAPLIVGAKDIPAATTVNGYRQQSGVWMPIALNQYDTSGRSMSVTNTGVFVFTGQTVQMPSLNSLPGSDYIMSLITRYGLDDYLGRDGQLNLDGNATRQVVAGCVARIAGAPKTADPITWIQRNLNVTMSARTGTGTVQNQEAIAMLMALYEKKTNTAVASITIRNYNATAGLTGLDTRYKQAVRAAVEIGIVDASELKPTSAVSVRTLLTMLDALGEKITL